MKPTESKKPIEIKNIQRSDTQPVFLKEKIAENGETKTVIYQRKNINQINGFFEKLKKQISYAAEDLSEKFELTSLKKILGFTSLTTLVSGAESKEALVNYKHKLNTTGIVDDSTKYILNKFFKSKNFDLSDAEFKINHEKYDTSEFLTDLEKIRKSPNFFSKFDQHIGALLYFEQSISSNLMTREKVKEISDGFDGIEKSMEEYFKDQKAPKKMQERFMNKLNQVRQESIKSEPTEKEMKEWCLNKEKSRYNYCGQGYRGNSPETDPNILDSINQFFSSTSSAKEKQAAQVVLQSFYKNERKELPLHIEKKIFPENEGFYESNFSPTLHTNLGSQRMISPDTGRKLDDDRKLKSSDNTQHFSENNQESRPRAVSNPIHRGRQSNKISSTSNPHRDTFELRDDD